MSFHASRRGGKIALGIFVALGLVAAVGSRTYAGLRTSSAVFVGSSSFSGIISSARNNAGSVEYIGCVIGQSAASSPWAACYANDITNAYKSCTTSDLGLIDLIRTVASDSSIYVVTDDSGNCTYIQVNSDSMSAPKAQ